MGKYVLIVIIALIVLITLWMVSSYNGLVRLRNKVKDLWAQIDVELKRRSDLIPNLVETVKGYAKHEKGTFEDVVKARNSLLSATNKEQEIKANDEMTKALSKIFALAENYPELKANTNFLKLQEDLKETEDKIAFSRQFYNDAAYNLKNKVEMFPSNIIASLFNFKAEPFFEATAEEKQNISVKF